MVAYKSHESSGLSAGKRVEGILMASLWSQALRVKLVCHFLPWQLRWTRCIFALLMWVSAALSTSCTPTLVKFFLVVNLYSAPCEHFVVCMCGTVVILWGQKATVTYRNRFSGLHFYSVLPFSFYLILFHFFPWKKGWMQPSMVTESACNDCMMLTNPTKYTKTRLSMWLPLLSCLCSAFTNLCVQRFKVLHYCD